MFVVQRTEQLDVSNSELERQIQVSEDNAKGQETATQMLTAENHVLTSKIIVMEKRLEELTAARQVGPHL